MNSLQRAIIVSYRRTVSDRYSIDTLAQIPVSREIPADQVRAMREFFLAYVYPEPDERTNLEEAFQSLGDVLTSPRKLWLLLGANPLRRLGGVLPTALKAGLHTFDAFLKIRKLERRLDELARQRGLTPEQVLDPSIFLGLIREMPVKEINRFRRDGTALLETLADSRLLSVTLEIMDDSIKIMDEHVDVFSEQERRGIALGRAILKGAHALFVELRPEQIPVIVAGIDSIEKTWFENVLTG